MVVYMYRYTQCEAMSAHYKQPILLIEFEEHKSFSLEVRPSFASTPLPHANTALIFRRWAT